MTKIYSIEICNFKYARGVFSLPLKGLNALVYGENGTGKSTIFWALHAFLDSAFKDKSAVEKYFTIGGDESLINRDMPVSDESYVEVTLTDNPGKKYRFSKDVVETQVDIIREACYASELINHRFLSRIYDQRNSHPLDVFQLLAKDIFPYTRFENQHIGLLWMELINNPPIKQNRSTKEYKQYSRKVELFNNLLVGFLDSVMKETNSILTEYFEDEELMIAFNHNAAKWDGIDPVLLKPNFKLKHPEIILNVKMKVQRHGSDIISRPQSFLNEGRLSLISIALRLAIKRLKNTDSPVKLLVLDDLLLSLDMSYRLRILEMIFNEFRDYQKLIMTHDKGFFEIVHSYIDITEWSVFEVQSMNSTCRLLARESEIERAKKFLANGDLELCGLFLRKDLERIVKRALATDTRLIDEHIPLHKQLVTLKQELDKNFLDQFSQRMFEKKLTSDDIKLLRTDYMNDNSVPESKKALLQNYHRSVIDFVAQLHRKKDHIHRVFAQILSIKNRVLNPAAHCAPEIPLYTKELDDAVVVIEQLNDIVNSTGLKRLKKEFKNVSTQQVNNDIVNSIAATSQAISNTLDCILDIEIPLDKALSTVLSCIHAIDISTLVRIFDNLSTHRMDQIKTASIDHFFLSLIRDRKWNEQEKAIIGGFIADLMNEGVTFSKRASGSFRRASVHPSWDGDEYQGEWVFNQLTEAQILAEEPKTILGEDVPF